ncbi:MAG: redox-sensing transcriptional repressor Rex [Christensenellaceae bacterium]|jgi:redox-sensing transcriptional repressor
MKKPYQVSKQALQRMPYYLNYLKTTCKGKMENVSARMIADALGLNEVQVRKDLAAVSVAGGKPKTGFPVDALVTDIETFLGYDNVNRAVLVGAGRLGKALMTYNGFENYGLEIIAAFDNAPAVMGTMLNGKEILGIDRLQEICALYNVHIGIITVPVSVAQTACDALIDAGVEAIWNFAPTHLEVPEGILVQNENMASSLAVLSSHLAHKMKEEMEEA